MMLNVVKVEKEEKSTSSHKRNVRLYESPAIVRKIASYKNYPYQRISPPALKLLSDSASLQGEWFQKGLPSLLRILECYLCVTNQRLTSTADGKLKVGTIYQGFVGALYSERFLEASTTKRYTWVFIWNTLLTTLKEQRAIQTELISPRYSGPTDRIKGLALAFDALALDEEQVKIWRGWPVKSQNDMLSWLDLRPIYCRYGRQFTEQLHAACESFISGRKTGAVPSIGVLVDFLTRLPQSVDVQNFRDPSFVGQMWREFLYHFVSVQAEVATYKTITDQWVDFKHFAERYLLKPELFTKAFAPFPNLPTKEVLGHITHQRTDENGETFVAKLLTDVPLYLTDEEALKILFHQIKADINVVVQWAECESKVAWKNFQRRKELASSGTVRPYAPKGKLDGRGYLTSYENPDYLANAAATFEHYGFLPATDRRVFTLYPRPLGDIPKQLGLPTLGALLPHMALLVVNHPELTPSFFENFELYDKNGHLSGVIEVDGGWVLSGYKLRKGPNLAEQKIFLSPYTKGVIEQVIELTQPLRTYLKNQGDMNWRRLFLSCGKGFSYPLPLRPSALTSDPDRVNALIASFKKSGLLQSERIQVFVKRFSLVSLRASVAVASYIDEPDVAMLAKKLGHTNYEPQLLARYLPAPLLAFFQERWIRLFQCAIIAEAMMDSPYLLHAVGFKTMEELHSFLKHHALKTVTRKQNDVHLESIRPTNDVHVEQVVFGVNVENLSMLVSVVSGVRKATRPVNHLAQYWCQIGERLIAYIEDCQPPREDLQVYLAEARALANSDAFEELIYA